MQFAAPACHRPARRPGAPMTCRRGPWRPGLPPARSHASLRGPLPDIRSAGLQSGLRLGGRRAAPGC
eukprot:4230385-Alexandrium_andersonii.AAC.1